MEPTDSIDDRTAQYLLVYQSAGDYTAWWAKWVDKELSHVEIWWEIGGGYYTAIRPYHHYLVVDIMYGPPQGVVQRVTAQRLHELAMFPVGLKTCVTIAKAVIGVRAAWVLTPRQLYNYVAKRGGVV